MNAHPKRDHVKSARDMRHELTSATIESYLSSVTNTLSQLPIEEIARVVETIDLARGKGKRVFLFGNGGSASTATHFACDLSKGGIVHGKPRIKAISLCDNVALLCAWANDTAYEHVFGEQLENLVEPGDVVIGISGSGNSPNVLNAIALGKARGATTIGFSGFSGGRLKGCAGRYLRGRPQPLYGASGGYPSSA